MEQALPRNPLIRRYRSIWGIVTQMRAVRHQRKQLAKLDDKALQDIGLSRADVDTETARPFWDCPGIWR